MDVLRALLESDLWPARWYCGQWSPFHGWTYIWANIAVWGAYLTIPFILLNFFRKRRTGYPYPWILLLFAGFIFACGTTHLLDAVAFWWPAYRLNTLSNVLTAAVSWGTVVGLMWLMPRALQLRTVQELEGEIAERTSALRAQQSLLAEVTQSSPVTIWMTDPSGQFFINQHWLEFTGTSEAENLGLGWVDYLHPEDREPSMAFFLEHTATGRPYEELIYRVRRHDGVYRHCLSAGRPRYHPETGDYLGFIGSTVDISERIEAQRSLQEVQQRYNVALWGSSDGLWIWNIAENRSYWSSRLNEILGIDVLQEAEQSLDSFYARVHPEDVGPLHKLVQQQLDRPDAPTFDAQFRVVRPDGTVLYVHSRGKTLRDSSGRAVQMAGALTDVTEQHLAQERLKHLENRFRRIFESDLVGVMFSDIHGQIFDTNDYVLSLLGYSREDISTMRWDALTPSAWSEADRQGIRELLETGRCRPYVKQYRHRDGHTVDILIGYTFIEGSEDQCVCFVLDISQQKAIERQLAETLQTEHLIRYILELVNESMDVDRILKRVLELVVLHFNADRAVLALYEDCWEDAFVLRITEQVLRSPEVIPVNPEDIPAFKMQEDLQACDPSRKTLLLNCSSPDTFPDFYRDYGQQYNIRAVVVMEITYRDQRYGRLIVHECRQDRVWQPKDLDVLDNICTYLGIALYQAQLYRNERQAREQAEDAKTLAEDANRRKSQFLANMSHELRTPLNAVIGYSEMLETDMAGPLTDKQRRYVHNVASSGKHLLDMVNDLLDIAKAEAGKINLIVERVSLQPLIDSLAELFQEQAARKQVGLAFQRDESLNSLTADPARLRQILINLIGNAIKFNKPGGRVHVLLYPMPDDTAVIKVVDTGIGIPQEKMDRLFSEFYQVEQSYARNYGGTGLGLALTRRLVELHGGSIAVESEYGQGSIFTVRLPMNQNPVEHTTALPSPPFSRRVSEHAAG